MTQNGDENPKIQLGETFYGHIRFQHYHIYQKPRERKRSMQPVDILGGLMMAVTKEKGATEPAWRVSGGAGRVSEGAKRKSEGAWRVSEGAE